MKFSISLFTSDRGIRPARAAQKAEEFGFHAFYVPEHTHIPASRATKHPATGDETLPDDRYMRTLDPWVALASAASLTSRILLGTSVALPAEHDPISLAKTIASLDYLSGGRVVLGAGFGWNLEEIADHGIPPKRRRTVLREYLLAMQELWTKDEAAFEGEFVRFGASWAWPKPLQQPRIPILIGAFGDEELFSWIAASADGWITTPIEDNLPASITLLQSVWSEAGRAGDPRIVVLDDQADDKILASWRDLGVAEVLYGLPDGTDDEALAYLEELSPLIDKFA
jgi:probable F420-dependent oxidoreductase